ncbi:MAG: glycoside hydrolase family 13 protein [Clostridiales bacterium]|jgi:glycosidase|nr:glycoside hydrolase family 13 protein [Clostridiales bacterium]
MKQSVEFDPLNPSSKNPVGAVKTDAPTRFVLRFSRPQNPDDVFLCLTKDGEQEVRYPMAYLSVDPEGVFAYGLDLAVTSRGLYFYYFVIDTPGESFRVAADENLRAMLGKGQQWQLTVYDEPFSPPSWLKGGVIYQIMPDRFNIGGERLKTKSGAVYRDDWGGTPRYMPDKNGKILNNDFFGGNIPGITKKLGYLKSLGVTCIYLNPIFEAASNHKYDTGNYRRVDSDFGTLDDFKTLIKRAAKKGIRVILDGVFSHTGDDSLYFNKYGNYDSVGAYQSPDSPYYEWYNFRDWQKRDYACWWNVDVLPNTVEENKYYDEFINGEDGIIRYWTDLGIGGWRLDVVDELPDKFLDRMVRSAKKSDPETLIVGEVWEDASNKISYSSRRRYLQGGQLDSVMNYPFKEELLRFIKTGDNTGLYRTVRVLKNNYPRAVLNNLMNIIGTHDTVRVLTALGDDGAAPDRDGRAGARLNNRDGAVTLLRAASVLQFTLPGVPCVYYGDEVGLEGFEDPFNRRCFPWDNKLAPLLRHYKKLGKIRENNRAVFADGEIYPLDLGRGVAAYGRGEGDDKLTVIVNNSGGPLSFGDGAAALTDLVTDKPFNGVVPDKTAVILKAAAAR